MAPAILALYSVSRFAARDYLTAEIARGEAATRYCLASVGGKAQRILPVCRPSPQQFHWLGLSFPINLSGTRPTVSERGKAPTSDGWRRKSLRDWARNPQGWKNVVRPSRRRFARHLRMRHF